MSRGRRGRRAAAGRAPASRPAPPSPDASPGPALPAFPDRAGGGTRRPQRRLPAASVPVVLLTLGGLCLLVAAVVFVARRLEPRWG